MNSPVVTPVATPLVNSNLIVNNDKPRKNLIAKHALLHSFIFFLANNSLQSGLFDQNLFDLFLRQFLFFDDATTLSNFFDNLHLKTLLKDAKNACKQEAKEKAGKGKKQNKSKKAKKESEESAPTDLISSLVNLANGTEPTVNASSPANVVNNSDAPGAPVKPKRKYTRKPKVVSISEELNNNEENA
jgi:hypothetical protein